MSQVYPRWAYAVIVIDNMWVQDANPFDSVIISALVAAVPIVVLCALLLSRKLAGHIASLVTLAAAVLIAIIAFGINASRAALNSLRCDTGTLSDWLDRAQCRAALQYQRTNRSFCNRPRYYRVDYC